MLNQQERKNQIRKQICKEFEQKAWKYDVDSYYRTQKLLEITKKYNNSERILWLENRLKEIRKRWPTVNW